jgi:hypothetical protein
MKILFRNLSLFVLLFVISCNQNGNEKKNTPIEPNLNYELAYNISQAKYLTKPDTVFLGELASTQYIAAVFETDLMNKKIIILSNFANTWQEQDIVNDLYGIVDVQFVTIDSLDYLFYADESYGNTMGGITFTLRELNSKKDYSILFNGYVGKYDKMEPIKVKVKNKKNILSFLEAKVASSPFVFKQSSSDYDLDNPSNYDKKWNILNSGLRENLNANRNIFWGIKFPEYQENLFTIINHGSEVMKIENPNYIIISYFKDNVIGYDKINKKYFGIWVPETTYDWISKLDFKSEHNLIITEQDEYYYSIDLKTKKIMKL